GTAAVPRLTAAAVSYAQQILVLVNGARRGSGCGPLVLDPRLQAAAREHTRDMAASGQLDHTGSDGSAPLGRAAGHGYPGLVGETIARGYGSASAVMQAWLGSPGHRANIENCDYRSLGVGYLAGGGWWTEVFGA